MATQSATDTFQLELAWCLAQLKIASSDKRAQKKRLAENERLARLLSSPQTAFPRKRQLMRAAFGDYREKMRARPLPERARPALAPTPPEGVFYRKSRSQQAGEEGEICAGNEFSFQFQIPGEDSPAESQSS